jgi:hypothetical protein
MMALLYVKYSNTKTGLHKIFKFASCSPEYQTPVKIYLGGVSSLQKYVCGV